MGEAAVKEPSMKIFSLLLEKLFQKKVTQQSSNSQLWMRLQQWQKCQR